MTTDPAALSHLRHELRTPLNHIIGYSEMLLEETDDARPAALAPALHRVHDEARQLLGLVNSVLGPSANETGVDVVEQSGRARRGRLLLERLASFDDSMQRG